MAYQECRREEVYLAEQQRKGLDCPAAERYYAEYVGLLATGSSAKIVLQEAINEKVK
jgi:hypothetical protein